MWEFVEDGLQLSADLVPISYPVTVVIQYPSFVQKHTTICRTVHEYTVTCSKILTVDFIGKITASRKTIQIDGLKASVCCIHGYQRNILGNRKRISRNNLVVVNFQPKMISN